MYDEDRWRRKMERWERKMSRWDRRMNRASDRQSWERGRRGGNPLFAGLLFIAIGMAFLLGNLGMIDTGYVLRFWPVLLIAIGVFKIVECQGNYAQSSGIFWIVVGGIFLLGSLGILRVTLAALWPVVLIGIGALLLWRTTLVKRQPPPSSTSTSSSTSSSSANPNWNWSTGFGGSAVGAPAGAASDTPGASAAGETADQSGSADSKRSTSQTSSNSILSAMAILGSVEQRNNCQDFRGGSLTAVM